VPNRRFSHERRNEIAREQGFRNYYEKRQAIESLKDPNVRAKFERGVPSGNWRDNPKALRAFYGGLIDPKTRHDKSRHSHKAEWFVNYAEAVADYDEWQALYNG
jgi:hypothetical protein